MGARHTSYFDEVQQELYTQLGVFASLPTLSRTFCWLGMTRKWVWKQVIGFLYLIFLSCFYQKKVDLLGPHLNSLSLT